MHSRQKKILIVDDEIALASVITDLLNSLGYISKSALNGREALEVINLFRPDLIISDIMMPEMDGIELTAAIKSNKAHEDIPVIMLTAKDTQDDRLLGLKTGADAYLSKPFNIRELQYLIKNLIHLRESAQANSALHLQDSEDAGHLTFQNELFAYLKAHLAEALDLSKVAAFFELSPSGFKKKIKRETSKNFTELIMEFRLRQAASLLKEGTSSVKEAAFACGFKSVSHFSQAFRKHYNISPSSVLQR